ncbi:MAG: C10 family peptidase [Tannerella sp.]|nr:C10 family peptidase [Tannerella sp.]
MALLSVTVVYAKKRTPAEAKALAVSFYGQQFSLRKALAEPVFTLAYACTDDDYSPASLRNAATEAYYYIFNTGDDEGFIIISGDDRADDVLGYATQGHFDIDVIPTNFRNWLSLYRSELKSLSETPELPQRTVYASHTFFDAVLLAPEIKPLLGNTVWGQNVPFNALCPIIPETDTRAIAGCVATAMAQIMKFYEWPAKGTGSKTYISQKHHLRLNVDFSQTAYEWAQMRDTYVDGEFSEAELNAVATLIYHCGVAAEMNYSYVSGASQQIAAFGMKDYFNYATDMQLLDRGFYATHEWYYLLKEELNASRPIFYVGSRDDGTAHAFVCDGYDRNGLFHFNWGWAGSGNGYFNVSIIEPWNMTGYNGGQNIVAGIQPRRTGALAARIQFFISKDYPLIASADSFGRNEKTAFSTGVYHSRVSRFSGEIGIGLYDGEALTAVLIRDSVNNLSNNEIYLFSDSIFIPETIEAGTYALCPVSSTDGVRWTHIRSQVKTPVTVTVDEQSVTIVQPAYNIPNIGLEKLTPLTEFYANKNFGRVEATLSNTGQEEAYTSVTFLFLPQNVPVENYIKNTVKGKYVKQEESRFVMLNPGERKTVTCKPAVTVPAGNYFLYVVECKTNTFLNIQTPERITILSEPELILTEKISFPYGNDIHNGDTLTVKIKNTGADFDGYLFADIHDRASMLFADSLKPQILNIRKNEEQTLKIALHGQSELPPGDYTIRLSYSSKPSKNVIVFSFTPEDHACLDASIVKYLEGSRLPSRETPVFYPSPAEDVLYIRSDENILTLSIFGLDGKQKTVVRPGRAGIIAVPVDRLPPGMYILRSETDGRVQTGKFVKK